MTPLSFQYASHKQRQIQRELVLTSTPSANTINTENKHSRQNFNFRSDDLSCGQTTRTHFTLLTRQVHLWVRVVRDIPLCKWRVDGWQRLPRQTRRKLPLRTFLWGPDPTWQGRTRGDWPWWPPVLLPASCQPAGSSGLWSRPPAAGSPPRSPARRCWPAVAPPRPRPPAGDSSAGGSPPPSDTPSAKEDAAQGWVTACRRRQRSPASSSTSSPPLLVWNHLIY